MRAFWLFLAALFGFRLFSNSRYNREFRNLPEEEQKARRRWF
ncbi:hypothetical protein [Beijerinckia indica]|uniref:Uncharacterized protein n=1 Tax=Beijerinckia indica subsp. indica (strain ATCC 9039 / DSM 1715 / NCIMB 8712) TaxID=395963 RepID=B2ICI1_BEII9|nr:hypothetical protein [Beijerinckia indica]ACB93870.1 hypothetical protein Bind_0214 [Beijerinckia indica subsp. indica ATCC 9039]